MQTITIANQKGGIGKTTTTVNLAAVLSDLGFRVLLLDMDGQANATDHLLGEDYDEEDVDLGDLFRDWQTLDLASVIVPSSHGVDVAPSGPYMNNLEQILAAIPATDGPHHILKRKLAAFAADAESGAKARYDFCLIDTPPSRGSALLNALTASDSVLVPIVLEGMAVDGLKKFIQTIESTQEMLNPGLDILGIVGLKVDRRRHSLTQPLLGGLEKAFPDLFMESFISENVDVAKAYSHAQPVTSFAPGSQGAKDFKKLGEEILGRLGTSKPALTHA